MNESILKRSGIFFIILTIICGVIYTLFVTALAQLLFSDKANGSIIEVNGKKYGSTLLAQEFTENHHLWGRPMKLDVATFTDANGNALMYAVPSNMNPAGNEYAELIKERVAKLQQAHNDNKTPIPVDLVTISGSGLDPHISPAAAIYQVNRIAKYSSHSPQEIHKIIKACTEGRWLGIFGEERVNVLKVNLMLEGILQ